jgi:hypothetical protein
MTDVIIANPSPKFAAHTARIEDNFCGEYQARIFNGKQALYSRDFATVELATEWAKQHLLKPHLINRNINALSYAGRVDKS